MDDRDMELTGGWPQTGGQFENPGPGFASCSCSKCMPKFTRTTQRLPTKTIEERRNDMFREHEATFGAGTWPFYQKRENMSVDLAAPAMNSVDFNTIIIILFFLFAFVVVYQMKIITDLRVAVASITGQK